jgi:hypothetical protein
MTVTATVDLPLHLAPRNRHISSADQQTRRPPSTLHPCTARIVPHRPHQCPTTHRCRVASRCAAPLLLLLLSYCAVRRCAAPTRCGPLPLSPALPFLLALEPLRHSHPRMTCPAAPESSIHANPGTLAVSAENFVVAKM